MAHFTLRILLPLISLLGVRYLNDPPPLAGSDWIVFACGVYEESEIYIVRPDGSGLYQLTENHYEDMYPSWSPDGEWIAFHSQRRQNEFAPYQDDIFRIRPDGGDLENLTNDTQSDLLPAWSPDGQQIIFASQRPSQTYDLFLLVLNSGERRQLTDGVGALRSAWSPNNQWIAYGDGRLLYKTDLRGNTQTIVDSGIVNGFEWSPDSQHIALSFSANGIGTEIGYVSANGGQIETLTDLGGASGFPQWLDNETLVFLHNGSIYQLDLQTQTTHPIPELSNEIECEISAFDWFLNPNNWD